MKDSIEKLMGFKEMIDEELSSDNFSPETKEKVSEKLKNIAQLYIQIKGLKLANKSDEEIIGFLEENGVNPDFIEIEINAVTAALFSKAQWIDTNKIIERYRR